MNSRIKSVQTEGTIQHNSKQRDLTGITTQQSKSKNINKKRTLKEFQQETEVNSIHHYSKPGSKYSSNNKKFKQNDLENIKKGAMSKFKVVSEQKGKSQSKFTDSKDSKTSQIAKGIIFKIPKTESKIQNNEGPKLGSKPFLNRISEISRDCDYSSNRPELFKTASRRSISEISSKRESNFGSLLQDVDLASIGNKSKKSDSILDRGNNSISEFADHHLSMEPENDKKFEFVDAEISNIQMVLTEPSDLTSLQNELTGFIEQQSAKKILSILSPVKENEPSNLMNKGFSVSPEKSMRLSDVLECSEIDQLNQAFLMSQSLIIWSDNGISNGDTTGTLQLQTTMSVLGIRNQASQDDLTITEMINQK